MGIWRFRFYFCPFHRDFLAVIVTFILGKISGHLVKVILVIFVFGFGHFIHYNINISFIYSGGF